MMNGLFSEQFIRRASAALWQMLQQRLIRSELERKREGGVSFGGKLNHVSVHSANHQPMCRSRCLYEMIHFFM